MLLGQRPAGRPRTRSGVAAVATVVEMQVEANLGVEVVAGPVAAVEVWVAVAATPAPEHQKEMWVAS